MQHPFLLHQQIGFISYNILLNYFFENKQNRKKDTRI